MTTPAWDEVSAAIAAAPYQVHVLPPDAGRAAECLSRLGVTTGSWLGAVVANTGGIAVDHGWLRILGSGAEPLPDILDGADPARLPVGHDVLGGQFVWTPGDSGRPTIHYFAPDDLQWLDLEQGYGDWLHAMLMGGLDRFYESLRWPGWQEEVAAVPLNQGIHTYPPPWSAEGKDLSTASRKAISITELVALHQHAQYWRDHS